HGRADANLPPISEWTSVDPEHSFPFCQDGKERNGTIGGCWQLTLAATRPLKVVYFDGSSAANMPDGGTMDAQDLLVWGKVDPARWLDERARLNGLCEWGKDFGIDGFVRMEMDFEVMICDFSQGLELVSADYLTAWWSRHVAPPQLRHNPASLFHSANIPGRGGSDDSPFPAVDIMMFSAVQAGTWRDHYPGDTRIQLDLTRFVSFYDTSFVPSLVPRRQHVERWEHKVDGISASDLEAVKKRLAGVLTDDVDTAKGSGVDWRTLYRVLLDRYAQRLELVEYLLDTTTTHDTLDRVAKVQAQLRIMLTPYILFTARPSSPYVDESWALPVWRGCATKHTEYIHRSSALQARLTESERLLLHALDETSSEICRVVVRMWVAGVHAGVDRLLPREDNTTLTKGLVEGWRDEHNNLMAWLDWGVWVKCRPACGAEEMCYLPTWPFFWDKMTDPKPRDDRWKRPQPRCIRKFAPYSQL
ncbi:hypothetical protein R3P38DRAFT_3475958, partial [Favolaschia claudopus]